MLGIKSIVDAAAIEAGNDAPRFAVPCRAGGFFSHSLNARGRSIASGVLTY
jgi:hypothetical protein